MDDDRCGPVAANRAALYHWFSQLFFAAPTTSDVVNMREGKASHLLNALAASPGANMGIQAMIDVLASDAPAVVATKLSAAHARLLDGVGGYETAPPYRSVYCSERGVLCQQETAEMERVLRQHRLRIQDNVHEPADHLSIQLEVMAQLALRLAETAPQNAGALPTLRREQADFLNAQLLSWLPAFSRRVVEMDALGFHAGLARALQAVLEQDHEYLTQATATPG
jgi:TorA-specific chaperone